jgi:hypothetical protein
MVRLAADRIKSDRRRSCWGPFAERLPETAEAFVHLAMIGLMVRRLAPPTGRRPWSSPQFGVAAA